MLQKITQSGLRWLWVTVFVIALDRITKIAAQHYLTAYEPVNITPFFNFTLAYNKGAAFSFLSAANGWQSWLFGLLAVGISVTLIIWLLRLSYQQRWISIALACVIGGAMGNLWDRLSYGHVIDFIDLYVRTLHWPVFNVADSAICIGAFMLVCDAIWKKE
jgi:signal peptidase II